MIKRFIVAFALGALTTAAAASAQQWVPIVSLEYNGQGGNFPHYFYLPDATSLCASWMAAQPFGSTCTFTLQNPQASRVHRGPGKNRLP